MGRKDKDLEGEEATEEADAVKVEAGVGVATETCDNVSAEAATGVPQVAP